MDPVEQFRKEVDGNIKAIAADQAFLDLSNAWLVHASKHFYSYNFSWLGRPIIQVPQDMYAAQELIWACRPDVIIETGIAHGGSLILSASMLAMLDYCDAMQGSGVLDVKNARRKVVGVDIDIRPHNRQAIEAHPLSGKIKLIQGSSVAEETVSEVLAELSGDERIMVFLDSNHTHEHVLDELEIYGPMTSPGSYCVVWDTNIEDLPDSMWANRPWNRERNPKSAVREYMGQLDSVGRKGRDGADLKFDYDRTIEAKLAFTAAPSGFLKRR